MASANPVIQKLKGTWEYIDGENFDEYLRELDVPWVLRKAAKAIKKEKLTISEGNNGKWTIKSETTFKNSTLDFTPDVEFTEIQPDGTEVKSTITFDSNTGRWIQNAMDKKGKKVHAERYIDDQGQQQLELTCNNVTARRRYKRVA